MLQASDVLKIDIGAHVNGKNLLVRCTKHAGHIIDSAFTLAFDPTYDNLLRAVREATNTGVKVCQVDPLLHLPNLRSAALTCVYVMLELQFRKLWSRTRWKLVARHSRVHSAIFFNVFMLSVKPIRNLNGHTLGTYQVHAGKSVPIVKVYVIVVQ